MRPILFRWRGLTIWSYPAMLYVGLVAGVIASNAAAHAIGMNALRAYVAICILTVPALVGARLLHVALHFPFYRNNPCRIWNRNEGGAALYGGLVLALAISLPLLAALGLQLGAFWDAATFTMLVAMIFGRIGCLMHGCCAGRASELWLSMRLPNHLGVWQRRIPVQCLEAGWACILLVFAIISLGRLPFPGALFLMVAAGYASGRFVLESFREQSQEAGRFTVHHGLSLTLILLSLATLKAGWPR